MRVFVEPGSDTSEPSFAEFLALWTDLREWQRGQVLSHHGLAIGVNYPVSALLSVASVAELILYTRSVVQLDFDSPVERSEAPHPSDRHVVLEWPPRGRLALIRQAMRADPPASPNAESA